MCKKLKTYKYTCDGVTKNYSFNSLENYYSIFGILCEVYAAYANKYDNNEYTQSHTKFAKKSLEMNECEKQRNIIHGMSDKLKFESHNINYLEMSQKVENEGNKWKYSKRELQYFKILALASLLFRNAP